MIYCFLELLSISYANLSVTSTQNYFYKLTLILRHARSYYAHAHNVRKIQQRACQGIILGFWQKIHGTQKFLFSVWLDPTKQFFPVWLDSTKLFLRLPVKVELDNSPLTANQRFSSRGRMASLQQTSLNSKTCAIQTAVLRFRPTQRIIFESTSSNSNIILFWIAWKLTPCLFPYRRF